MADLINRQALMEDFRKYMEKKYDREKCVSAESCEACEPRCLWHRIVVAARAVDAVEVVRCKNCIGWTTWLKTKEPNVSMCGLSGLYVGNHRDDLFCPYGERREDNG